MTEEQNNIIRQLVKEKRYDDARDLLLKIRGDPMARQWLKVLEDIYPRDGKFIPFKFDLNALVISVVLIVCLSLFVFFLVASIAANLAQP